MNFPWISLGLLWSLAIHSEACTCNPEPIHPQVGFCGLDFIVKAKVLKRSELGMGAVYTVQIIRDYKQNNRKHYYRRHGTCIQEIHTPENGAACGVSFRIGEEYTIAGYITDQQWYTHLCTWRPNDEQLNAYISGYYKDTCDCDVRACFQGQCPLPAPNRCIVPQEADISCFFKQNTCRPGKFGCAWHSPACFGIQPRNY